MLKKRVQNRPPKKKKPYKFKNRFRDILPYENEGKRVLLLPLPGIPENKRPPGDDYINASRIHDFSDHSKDRVEAYISTQGPKCDLDDDDQMVDTTPDFWRMVWDNKSQVIVMLTKIVEDDDFLIEKCTQYWPKVVGDMMDMHETARLTLTWVEEDDSNKDEFIIRTFVLRRGEEERIVRQLHYTGWPDHGVPKSAEEFVRMSDKVDELNEGSNGAPLVVHCSAGVGRSGTFIGIHAYVKFLRKFYDEHKDLPDLNVPKLLIMLRNDRPKMVQTKEQYEFIYKAILYQFKQCFDDFIKKVKDDE